MDALLLLCYSIRPINNSPINTVFIHNLLNINYFLIALNFPNLGTLRSGVKS